MEVPCPKESPNNADAIPSYARGLSVLVVDPDPISLFHLSTILESYTYKVTTTQLANIALSMIQEDNTRFKLVVCNADLPDMDNQEFLKKLLENDLAVISVLPYRDVAAAKMALNAGASFCIYKPVTDTDLKDLWQHHFGQKGAIEKSKDKANENDEENVNDGNEPGKKDSDGDRTKIVIEKSLPASSGSQNIAKNVSNPVVEFWKGTADNYTHYVIDLKGHPKKVEDERALVDQRRLKELEGGSGASASPEREGQGELQKKRASHETDKEAMKEKLDGNKQQSNAKDDGPPKKKRMVWTDDLHQRFIDTIDRLGHEKAVARTILEEMNEPSLTLRQITSHLQKHKAKLRQDFEEAQRKAFSGDSIKSNFGMGANLPTVGGGNEQPSTFFQDFNSFQLGNQTSNFGTGSAIGDDKFRLSNETSGLLAQEFYASQNLNSNLVSTTPGMIMTEGLNYSAAKNDYDFTFPILNPVNYDQNKNYMPFPRATANMPNSNKFSAPFSYWNQGQDSGHQPTSTAHLFGNYQAYLQDTVASGVLQNNPEDFLGKVANTNQAQAERYSLPLSPSQGLINDNPKFNDLTPTLEGNNEEPWSPMMNRSFQPM